VEGLGGGEHTTKLGFKEKESPFGRLLASSLLSLSLVLSPPVVPRRAAHGGSTPPGTRERCLDLDPEDLLPQLCWIRAGSIVEHRMCAKLRGDALAVLMIVREDFYTIPRSATKYDYINHVLAGR
jgi:hypothetical protein